MEQTEDLMEHMLAVALCADAPASNDYHQGSGYTMPRWIDGGMASMTAEMPMRLPKRAFAYSSDLDGERIYATTHELLMCHPAEIIGNGFEVMSIHKDYSLWTMLEPVKRLPRGLAAVGRVHYWAAIFMRCINENGMQTYHSSMVPFSKSGQPLAATWRGAWVSKPTNLGRDAIGACSMVEDAQRPNAMLASVSDGVELTFPVEENAYLEAFALRDAPTTAQGKRRALLHWVAKHIRRTKHGNTEVRRHMRGVHEFNLGGYGVRLWSADISAPDRAAWPVTHNAGHEGRQKA